MFQSMKDAALATCPEAHCKMKPWGKGDIKRKIGAGAGFIFKGGGFYITDYRSEGYKSKAKSESGGGGGDSKPVAAPAASTPAPAPAKTETKKAD